MIHPSHPGRYICRIPTSIYLVLLPLVPAVACVAWRIHSESPGSNPPSVGLVCGIHVRCAHGQAPPCPVYHLLRHDLSSEDTRILLHFVSVLPILPSEVSLCVDRLGLGSETAVFPRAMCPLWHGRTCLTDDRTMRQ